MSDLFAQLVVERRSRPQWRRTLAFAIFGALYLGFFAQFKYAVLYTSLFGATKTGPVIAAKLLADMIISAPLIYFPAYYTLKGVIHGTGARKEIRKYLSSHGMDMLTKYWVVWCAPKRSSWATPPPLPRMQVARDRCHPPRRHPPRRPPRSFTADPFTSLPFTGCRASP